MQVKFAVYNCGTGFNRDKDDVIAQLNRETLSPHMVTDGPGSGGFKPRWAGGRSNPGGTSTIGGLVGGSGVDANVRTVVAEIRRRKLEAKENLVVSMCGWSRGGITCFKVANALHASTDTRDVPINIFAIDPVPGGSALNNHMWNALDTTPNIRMCHVVFSQHDRRGLFSPYYPPVRGPFTDVDLMPGDHSTIVKKKAGKVDAYVLVKDLAKRFMTARGVSFKGSPLMAPKDILECYGRIAAGFDNYSKLASGVGKWAKFRGSYDDLSRVVRDVNRKEIGQILPIYDPGKKTSFFLNEHHRMTCQQIFPRLTNELDRKPKEALDGARRSSWMPDFDKMFDTCVEHSKLVLAYYRICEAARK